MTSTGTPLLRRRRRQQRGGRQPVVPVVLADRVQERVELTDVVAVALPAGQLGVQVGEVALQHHPVDPGQLDIQLYHHVADAKLADRALAQVTLTNNRLDGAGGGAWC